MSHTLKFKTSIAILAIASLTLSGCSSSEDSSTSQKSSGGAGDGLTIGTLLPNTGTLAFLGPPTVAGVGLADVVDDDDRDPVLHGPLLQRRGAAVVVLVDPLVLAVLGADLGEHVDDHHPRLGAL